jgi:hypothetical protein
MPLSTLEPDLIATPVKTRAQDACTTKPSSLWRNVFSFPAMLFAWIVLVVVRLAERDLPDTDIWWHLRNAQFLLTHHALPNFDAYSYTVAGHPWLNHEWLSEIPYYLALRTSKC